MYPQSLTVGYDVNVHKVGQPFLNSGPGLNAEKASALVDGAGAEPSNAWHHFSRVLLDLLTSHPGSFG